MEENELYHEQEFVNISTGYWYGYSISYDLVTAPESRNYRVVFFRQDYPTEEVSGYEWDVNITHTAWFPTLEEAKAAAEAFADEMHWQREAEHLGVGRELRKRSHDEVVKVARELRKVSESQPERLTTRGRFYDQDKFWERDEQIINEQPVVLLESTDNEFVRIEVTGRTHPTATDYWDGNWLNAEVSVKVGSFRAHVGGYLRTEDFITFRDELSSLYSTLSGSASFTTMEDWISIQMVGDGKGHISADCTVMDKPGIGSTLEFKLQLDQTFLPSVLEQLIKVCAAFPTKASKRRGRK